MIATIPVALTAAPATAAIAATGLEPLLWTTVGLMAAAVALIVRDAHGAGPSPRGTLARVRSAGRRPAAQRAPRAVEAPLSNAA